MSLTSLLRPESDKSEARLSLLAMCVGGVVVHRQHGVIDVPMPPWSVVVLHVSAV